MRKALIIFGTLMLLLKLAVFVRDYSKSRTKLKQQQQKQQSITKTQAAPKSKTIPIHQVTTNDTTVYKVVESMPYLESCSSETDPNSCSEKKLLEFIYKRIEYNFGKDAIPDQFIFSFIVEKDGTISDVQELKGKGQTNFKEIIHQLSWIPGKIKGQSKRVLFMLPMRVHFAE